MPFGAALRADGRVRFRLWAPSHKKVRLELDGADEPEEMQALGDGWHERVSGRAGAGTRYRFILPDGFSVPDPASR
ncbi:MAG: malto-oligosyltrehalose trehalohydrolase, partial [Stellaceae bacterium]